MINTGGNLKFRNNYTTKVGDYFDVLSLAYASGDATLKGKLNINGEGLYLSSSGTYPRFRVVSSGNDIHIQAGKGDGSAQEGYLNITGINNTFLKSLTLKSDQTVIPGRVIIKNAKAHDALDVFTTYNATTYLRLGRDYGTNNCAELMYNYGAANSTNNSLKIGFYSNSTSLLRGYAGGNWELNNNLSINKEFNANDKHFNYALAYKEIPSFDAVGMVVITLPNTWNTAMNLYEIDIYDYVAGTKVDDAQHSKLTIGVYNYSNNYYNYGYTQLGSFNRKVRLAHDGTHCCILLGEPTSTWNFTQIFLSRVLSGRSEHHTWTSGYEINLVTSEAAYTKITELHRTRQRFDDVVADNFRGTLVGNADTASSAAKWTTARTIALGEAVKSTATAFDGSANISIPVTELKESYLVWGDKNKVNDLGVIDNCFSDFSSNKLSFMSPDQISVEYSNDGGSTWTDYGATAEQKTAHVTSTLSHSFYLGNSRAQTTQDRLRITITAADGNLYFAVRKLMIYFCMNGATGNTVLVETSKCGSDTTFTALGTYQVAGWSGWNSIPVYFNFGGSDTQTGNTRRIRFTYQFTGHSSGYENRTAAFVHKTYMFGGAPWSSPHSLSSTGHLYSFDVNQRAVFPKLVEAVSGFKKTGSNDNYVLLGGGGHKAISSFQTTYDSRYVLKSGDTMTGKLEISGAFYPLLTLTRSGSTNGALIGFKNNNGTLGYIGMKNEVNSGLYRYTDDTVGIYKVWDEGNDGPGSGLNADLLDGTHKSDLLSSITSTHTTNLSVIVGGATKNVTKLWSSMLSIKDIRGTNVNPNDSSIQSNAITAWFNNTGTPTANWYSGFSVKGWDNTYGVWQLCSYSSDGTPTGSLYFRQGEDDTWKNWRAILDDSNTSVSGGGSNWGDSITININGTSTTLTIPNQPEDVNVTQTNTTTSANYRVLLSKNANDTTETASSRKSAKLYFNPSTGVLTTTKVSANLDGDIVKKTPQLCAATESDNINIVENSNGAITNNYISTNSAIRKAIQFKWYSTYWQIGNIRGGASGTDGFGVTYGSDKLCFRVTEAASYVYGNMYAVHFYESSDKRLKTNIQEILNSDKMPTIKEFDWKEDGSHSYGLIAQELEEQGYSELVSIKDNGYKTVNYSAALSLIVGKLQAKIKELEKEIENLRNKN